MSVPGCPDASKRVDPDSFDLELFGASKRTALFTINVNNNLKNRASFFTPASVKSIISLWKFEFMNVLPNLRSLDLHLWSISSKVFQTKAIIPPAIHLTNPICDYYPNLGPVHITLWREQLLILEPHHCPKG
ncbi:18803_t:CDS:2 [Rhizophagus irregularis]|nr:18803_t:CDS:2 [Rhizophagus irregularis]